MTDFLFEHHLLGLAIGICTFLIIGVFHPITIKFHYCFGTGCWWFFLLLGVGGIAVTMLVDNVFWSSLAGVFAFSSFWTIGELFQQEKRVARGWFPANPKRRKRD